MTTIEEMQTRIERLESDVAALRDFIERERSIEGVRKGIESMRRGEGLDAREALSDLRAELFPNAPVRRWDRSEA